MLTELRLPDGTAAMVWPLLRSDREALIHGYSRLSDASRRRRFLTALPRLTERLADALVDAVDGVNHVALVLVVLPDDASEEVVGVARMVRYPDDPTSADVAVTVLDEWQGRGVASALLRELVALRPAGVQRLVTEVANDNSASLAMLSRLGPTRTTFSGDGTATVVVTLEQA